MKRLVVIAALGGCSDDPVQTAWTMELTYQSTSCAMSTGVTFWIMDKDGGFATSMTRSDDSGRMDIETQSGDSYDITIASDLTARFLVDRRRLDDATRPDPLTGSGSVERTGQAPCRDLFTLEGIIVPDDATCGDPEAPCATNFGWQWNFAL